MDSNSSRLTVAGQLLLVCLVAAVLFPAMSPGDAVHGGVLVKMLFLGRMAVLIALATWLLRLRKLRWADLGLRRPGWLRFGLSIIAGLALTVAVAALVGLGLSRAGLPAASYTMFAPLQGNLPEYLFWLLPVTWLSAAVGEELLFRGFVRDALERLLGGSKTVPALAAIVAQAVLFGLLHLYQGAGGAVMAGSIGLVLGAVWLFSGRNLWAGIVVHGLVDSTAMTAIYLGAVHH